MKKTVNRFFSMLLVLSMVIGLFAMPAMAAPAQAQAGSGVTGQQTGDAGQSQGAEEDGSKQESGSKITFTDEVIFNSQTLKVDLNGDVQVDDSQIDYNDPAIVLVESELQTMKVLNADGEQVGLTAEQIGTVLYLYQQYLDHWTANANVLGVQVPFFLAYNDNGEDGLGVLGEMLALANVPVDAIRAGQFSYDDLVGMIQNFTYGDVLGVNFYGEAIAAARDEVLALVEASGAKTNAQKLLVINDWLAHVNTFDMPYIMNTDKEEGEKPMIAETPVKHERYDDVYNVIFNDYKPQIAQQFHDPIYAEVVASMRQTFYEEAIRAAIRQQAVEMGITEASKQEAFVNAAVEQYRQEQYQAALEAEQQKVYDEAYAEAYDEYLWDNCEHTFQLVTMHWTAKADGGYDAVADVCCSNCEITIEGIEATVSKDEAQSVAPTCTEDGAEVYIALAKIIDGGNVILGTVTETKTDVVPATGHSYADGICGVCGEADPDYVAPTEPSEEPTEPEVTEPEVTEPEVTEPEVTEPEVTEPEVTEPEVTEPEATEPETTEPSVEGGESAQTVNADADLEAAAAAAADTAANAAVEGAAADIEAAATAAADAAVAALTDEEKYALARPLVEANADAMAQIEAEADAAAENFMTENADAIAADALGFITATFGEEAAAQFEAQCDAFIETAETEGVEVAEGVVMTIEDMVQNTMANEKVINLGTEEEPYMVTPNEAIDIYADQAAVGLTGGVINYWEGSQFGALGFGTSVCLGYSKAFTYLVQCLFPEVYGKNGADTDLSVSENWKTREELYYDENGELDLEAGYVVDLVRITFDASVTMFGETEDNFNSDHFWNAVKLDGKWYYVDPCYTDVFTEVMMRERVETDGSMNHLYFLFSHPSCEELYEGNYKEIKTMYADLAVNKEYEDSWFSRIKSNVYSDGTYFYYLYDSTDMLTMMEEYENNQDNMEEMEEETILYRIVRHKIDTDDLQDGDADFEAIINFNYYETEDSESYALVYDPTIRAMEDSPYITDLFAEHQAIGERYPALAITMGIRGDKMYFNLSTKLLCYDMTTGEITVVKEYTDVHAVRDDTNPFGGMAFTVTNNAEEADLSVSDHPIAGVTVKPDGKLYVSVATNFAFISGKDPFDIADQTSYGYEFEESNYNPDYSSYNDYGDYTDEELEGYGYEKEINDNDEFMWTANFVDILELDHLEGTEHTYEAVTVAPHCDRDGFTENRCTTCGAIEDGSRVWDEGTVAEHHYIHFEEMYYGKDDAGRRLTGECYVCTICGDSVEEPKQSSDSSMGGMFGDSTEGNYEEEKAAYDEIVANAGHDYVPTDATWTDDSTSVTFSHLECSNVCKDVKPYRDCLVEDETISVTLSSSVTASASVTDYEGDCTSDLIAIYTATGEAEGYTYTASNAVAVAPGSHAYQGTFTWNGTESATADLVCAVCGDTRNGMEATISYDPQNSVAATCQATGNDVYIANVVVKDDAGNQIGSATDTKNVELAIVDHKYVNNSCNMCGKILLETPTVEYCYSKSQTSVKVAWSRVEGAEGYQLMRTTTPEDESSWVSTKTINSGDTTTYTNQSLTEGVTYYYRVRAFANHEGSGKVWSSFSNVGHMPAAVVWDEPYSNSDFRIRLRWNEVDGAHGYQIWRMGEDGNYSVVKTIGDKGNQLTNDQGDVTAYSNVGLTAGAKYTYKMRAFYITEDGKKVFGTYSDEVTVGVQPSKPSITLSTPKAGRVMVSWNDFERADGFQVWMSESAGGKYTIVKSVEDGTATSYTKYSLESGKTYYFKVRAYVEVDGKKTFGAYSTTMSIRVS